MRAVIIVILANVLIFMLGQKAESNDTLVNVGSKIPHTLNLLDQKRKKRSFENLSGKKGIILVFIRSVDWCTYCQKQVQELNINQKKFKDKGYNIVTVSYDSVLTMTGFLRKNNPTISMLSDPRSKSIKAFGLTNTDAAVGTRSYGMAKPAIYIINNKQIIQAILSRQGYKNRPSINEILAKINQLNPILKKSYTPAMTIKNMGQDPIILGDDTIDLPDNILPDVLSLPDEADSGVSLSADDYEDVLLDEPSVSE